MYLIKKTYVKNWDHYPEDQRHEVQVKGPQAGHIRTDRVCSIEEDAMYWRKANAIHNWFVQECQSGVDECLRVEVPREKLEELSILCETVLENPKDAASVLQTRSGFFFGSTEYDEYFFEQIQKTRDGLVELLQETEDSDFQVSWHYHSSW